MTTHRGQISDYALNGQYEGRSNFRSQFADEPEATPSLSLGGVPRSFGEYGNRMMEYSLGDKKTIVTFSNDRATDIQESKP